MRVAHVVVVAGVLLGLAVALLAGATEPWGKARDGLRTQLVADKTTWTVGETVVLRLELRNEGPQAATYDDPQSIDREGGLIVRRDGQPVRYISGSFQTGGSSRPIAPGQTQTIAESRVSDYWDFRKPGRYTVQFAETPSLGGIGAGPLGAVLPASNTLEIEVKLPADGKVPPLDVQARGKVYVGQNQWSVPAWQGLVFNYDESLPPASADWFSGAFSVALPAKSLPVHENRSVLLAVRMPTCGADSRFAVTRATVDGAKVRVMVSQESGRHGSLIPYLVLDLERRLGPGAYTCQVQLRPAGAEATQPQSYEFPFTILPAE